MLQCVAVCCSVLQCVQYGTSGMIATGAFSSSCRSVHCSVLQCVVECCSALQCVTSGMLSTGVSIELQVVVPCRIYCTML